MQLNQVQKKKCEFCDSLFRENIFEIHTQLCTKKFYKQSQSQLLVSDKRLFKTCDYCLLQIEMDKYIFHRGACSGSTTSKIYKQICPRYKQDGNLYSKATHILQCLNGKPKTPSMHQQFFIPDYYNNKMCYWCQQQISINQQQNHQRICLQKLRIKQDLQNYNLSQMQYRTLAFIYRRSAYQHLSAQNRVQAMIFSKGFTEEELLQMKQFIEHQAPLIIHTNLSKNIRHFVIDGEYRSLFQINTSGGNSSEKNRRKWESYLFGNGYDQCQPNQRIKYAVMNYANDKYGMMKCRVYGKSIIVLKNSIRKRCTIAHNRKYAPGQIVATLKYPYSVLQKFNSWELSVLSLAMRGFQVKSDILLHFKQIHVHGPIRFSQDVQCIYTTKQQLQKLIIDVKAFQNKFGVKITAIEDFKKIEE